MNLIEAWNENKYASIFSPSKNMTITMVSYPTISDMLVSYGSHTLMTTDWEIVKDCAIIEHEINIPKGVSEICLKLKRI